MLERLYEGQASRNCPVMYRSSTVALSMKYASDNTTGDQPHPTQRHRGTEVRRPDAGVKGVAHEVIGPTGRELGLVFV